MLKYWHARKTTSRFSKHRCTTDWVTAICLEIHQLTLKEDRCFFAHSRCNVCKCIKKEWEYALIVNRAQPRLLCNKCIITPCTRWSSNFWRHTVLDINEMSLASRDIKQYHTYIFYAFGRHDNRLFKNRKEEMFMSSRGHIYLCLCLSSICSSNFPKTVWSFFVLLGYQ